MAKVLPFVMLVDLIDEGRGFKVRLIGGELRKYLPGNSTGKSFYDDDPLLSRRRMCMALKKISAERLPCRVDVPASNLPGKDIFRMESLGIPLSQSGHAVDFALCGMVFTPRGDLI